MKHRKKRITTYFKERELKGQGQKEAQLVAYGKDNRHGNRIEKGVYYNKLKVRYADTLLQKTDFSELADLQIRNARQDKDKGASNKAVESIIERLEPSEGTLESGDVKITFEKKARKDE